MSEVRDIPGRNDPPTWFLGLLLQFRDVNNTMHTWAKEQRAKHNGSPLFFCQAGMKSIAVTDAVAASYVFSAPEEEFSRLPDRTGFGPVRLQESIIGPIRPALVAAFDRHRNARGFINEVLESRLDAFDDALIACTDALIDRWSSQGGVPYDELRNLGPQAVARWLFEIENLDGPSAGKWLGSTLTVVTRSKLANFLVGLMRKPSADVVAAKDYIHAQVRASPRFAEICEIGKKYGFNEEESLCHVVFMMGFNSAAPGFSAFATLCQLDVKPEWAGVIRDEVGDAELTPSNVDGYPKLNQMFMEINRLYNFPRLFFRIANKDVDLKCADGNTYRVLKGDVLMMVMRAIHQDGLVFDNPDDFMPERYAEGNDLGKYTFIFGSATDPYRCAGAGAKVEVSTRWWKYLVARLLQGYEWEFNPRPTISADASGGGDPVTLKVTNFRKRSA